MLKLFQHIHPLIFLVIATTMEVSGDALIRKAIFGYSGVMRATYFAVGTALLLGYATSLNLAPIEFGKVVGLYIATLFIVWQIITYFSFHVLPSAQVLFGGLLIVTGGLIVTFGGR